MVSILDILSGALPLMVDVRQGGGSLLNAARGAMSPGVIAPEDDERVTYEGKSSQTQRLENLGQLAGGVAHDFNNLLAVILNYTSFVAEDLSAADEKDWLERVTSARSDLAQVSLAAQRAANLTRQPLAFARQEVIRPQVLNLDQVISSVEEMLQLTIGERVELVTSLSGDLWPVLADQSQLQRVLVNLTVSMTFPVTAEVASELIQPSALPRSPKGETVLVVEDEQALREVTDRILTRNGYRVLMPATGQEALQIARDHVGEIHLLVTDVVMPHILGMEVAERMRVIAPGIEVLFMSGYARQVLASQGRLDANVALVEKPFSEAELLEQVGHALNRNLRGFTTIEVPAQSAG
jgi:CheY-like chemotaxis protein